MTSYFAFDPLSFIVVIPFLAGFYFYFIKPSRSPYIFYSHLENFSNHSGKKALWAHLPKRLYLLGLLFLLGAFTDPRMMSQTSEKEVQPLITEGRALYLVLDTSGSMKSIVVDEVGKQDNAFPTKIDLLKEVTQEFIVQRPQDLLGLITFARAAHVKAPLTLNHDLLMKEVAAIHATQNPIEDGTAIGYAIYKTASIIAATRSFGEEERKKGHSAYNIKGSAIILITDGFQFPNPRDKGKRLRTMGIEEAADYAKKQGVKLYIISIDPQIKKEEFAPQRRLMTRSAEITGGKFFTSATSKGLSEIYASINQLEESKVPVVAASKGIPIRLYSIAPFLIWAGLTAFFGGVLLETLFLRRLP